MHILRSVRSMFKTLADCVCELCTANEENDSFYVSVCTRITVMNEKCVRFCASRDDISMFRRSGRNETPTAPVRIS